MTNVLRVPAFASVIEKTHMVHSRAIELFHFHPHVETCLFQAADVAVLAVNDDIVFVGSIKSHLLVISIDDLETLLNSLACRDDLACFTEGGLMQGIEILLQELEIALVNLTILINEREF